MSLFGGGGTKTVYVPTPAPAPPARDDKAIAEAAAKKAALMAKTQSVSYTTAALGRGAPPPSRSYTARLFGSGTPSKADALRSYG